MFIYLSYQYAFPARSISEKNLYGNEGRERRLFYCATHGSFLKKIDSCIYRENERERDGYIDREES